MSNALQTRQAAVSKAIYFNCSRRERRDIAIELAQVRNFRAQAQVALDKVVQRYKIMFTAQEELGIAFPARVFNDLRIKFESEVALISPLANAPTPLHLLACGGCGKTPVRCTCTNSDGSPLDWGPDIAERRKRNPT